MVKGVCTNCKKEKYVAADGKSQGLCHVCYKKLIWKPKLIVCKRCKRELPMQAKGLCRGCYNSIFHIEKVKAFNKMKIYGLDYPLYQKITSQCVICRFDKIVDLHHLDHNRQNKSPDNLVGLCPNHHKMLHYRKYQREVLDLLKEKGFKVPETYEKDDVFKA